jgi:hypothetical protein
MNPNSLLDKLGTAVSGLGFWPKVTKFLPIGAILAQYDGGKLFREVVATLMKLSCIGVALGALGFLLKVLEVIGDFPLPALLMILFVLVISYTTIVTLWKRANDIHGQPDSEINITPILVVMIRTGGEIFSFILYAYGIFGFFIATFGGIDAGIEMGKGIDVGIGLLITGLVGGFFVTLGAYFWAELVNITVSIAKNLEKIAKSTEKSA